MLASVRRLFSAQKRATASSSKSVIWVISIVVILVAADLYLMLYAIPGLWSWLSSGVGLSQVFFIAILALHIWILFSAYKKKHAVVFVLAVVYVLAALLLSRWFFNAEGQQTVKRYKAFQTVASVLTTANRFTQAASDSLAAIEGTSAMIVPAAETLYSVSVPLKYETVEIEHLRLEKGDRLVPMYISVTNVSLPGRFSTFPVTGLGAVAYYQENGNPFYLGVQNMPEAQSWILRHKSQDHSIADLFVRDDTQYEPFAKNDNSVFASLQMQLNRNWEWVRPPHVMLPADSAQPILLGANLQRETGHEGTRGSFRLIFRINRAIVGLTTPKP